MTLLLTRNELHDDSHQMSLIQDLNEDLLIEMNNYLDLKKTSKSKEGENLSPFAKIYELEKLDNADFSSTLK